MPLRRCPRERVAETMSKVACRNCGAPSPREGPCPICGEAEPDERTRAERLRRERAEQPRRPPMRACIAPGCGRACVGTRCPEHQRAENARRHAKQEEHGRNTPEWISLSRARRIMAGRCELEVDDRCTGWPDTAHLNPERNGEHRGATLDDVRAACRHCHGVVDAPRAKKQS
jgi:hypothetical protein